VHKVFKILMHFQSMPVVDFAVATAAQAQALRLWSLLLQVSPHPSAQVHYTLELK
jgi:DUF1365 family protein